MAIAGNPSGSSPDLHFPGRSRLAFDLTRDTLMARPFPFGRSGPLCGKRDSDRPDQNKVDLHDLGGRPTRTCWENDQAVLPIRTSHHLAQTYVRAPAPARGSG
jgi:hypothetical protein